MTACTTRGCPQEAVALVAVGAGRRAPRCFQHEREAVDRDGVAACLPVPIAPWRGTVAEAVAGLRGGPA